jgi:outer membrane protein W
MFHVTRDSRVDVYLGPEIGYVKYGNVRLAESTEDVKFKDDFIWGGKVGIAVPFNEQWSFDAAVEHLAIEGTVENATPEVSLDPNPVVFTAGAALRF